jgi:hypothetical protein
MKYACAFFLALAVALASGTGPAKKLADMRENETVLIDYSYLNSFAVDHHENMRIRVERLASGWRARYTFEDRLTGKPAVVSRAHSLKQIEALDTAIAPKIYGEDDIQLSGEHVIELHWSSGEYHRFRKTGDDDRFMKLVWGVVSEKEEPNQPLQRNAGSRPSSGDSPAFETPSSLGPRG